MGDFNLAADDDAYDAAQKLLSSNEEELRARMLAAVLRSNDRTNQHVLDMNEQALDAIRNFQTGQLNPKILAIATRLSERPELIDGMTNFLAEMERQAPQENNNGD